MNSCDSDVCISDSAIGDLEILSQPASLLITGYRGRASFFCTNIYLLKGKGCLQNENY